MTAELQALHPHVNQFLEAVRPWAKAYRNSTLTFVALDHENEFVILAANLQLRASFHHPIREALQTTSLRVAEVPLLGDSDSLLQFVRAAVAGGPLAVGDYVLKFLADTSMSYTAFHEHASSEYRPWDGSYVDLLRLGGARRADLLNNRAIALESELQPKGYRSLNELMRQYGFVLPASDMLSIEITAQPIARISADSTVRGHTAQITVDLAAPLSPDQFSSTLVDADPAGPSFRRVINGRDFTWTPFEDHSRGVCAVEIPKIAIVMCRAAYSGFPQDERQIWDAGALPNLRRTLVELADPELQRLRGPLIAPKTNNERDEFEAGIAVLLHMLGFDCVRVGGVKRLSDAVDIFATTSDRQILIVECTTSVLDPKDKLGKLLERVAHAQRTLSGILPGFNPNDVTGMIVIPKAKSDLGAGWRIAEQGGVIVLCRPEIEAAIESTRYAPNADLVLRQWRRGPLTELMTNGLQGIDHQF